MKSFLLVALLAVAAAASVITNEAPEEPEVLEIPEGLEVADVDEVAGLSELAVITTMVKVADEAEIPWQPSFAPRRGLSVGNIGSADRLMSRTTHSRMAVANQILTQDVTYRGSASTIITAIRVQVIGSSQGATASVVDGALGRNFITIRLQSARGRGYNYAIEIWGR
uniref:H-type lectin domain-containing protein n=1 Tax=Heliothis virescens TaxID=7102 RepID=A0A2A4JHI4_HELVI